MKTIGNRIRNLEHRIFPNAGQKQRLWVTTIVGRKFALDQDKCIDILRECGFLPTGRFAIVSFCGIPDGLNAKELEKYLRTYGTQAPGFGLDRQESMPSGMNRLGNSKWPNQAQMASDGT